MDHDFDVVSKNSSLNSMSQRFHLLCSRSFIVFPFIFRPLIHFEVILVKCGRSVCELLCMEIEIIPAPLIEFPLFLCRISVFICVGLFWGWGSPLFHPVNLCVYSFTSTMLSWLLKLYTKPWNLLSISHPILLFFIIVLAIIVISFSYKLQSQVAFIYKTAFSDFDWDYTECIDQFGSIWHFNNFESSNMWTLFIYMWVAFHLFRPLISFISFMVFHK